MEREIDDAGLNSEQIRRIIRDDYMQDSTVLLLLCGQNTRRRKHIDWEIHTAMYDSDANPQMGIVVVNLPTISQNQLASCDEGKQYFSPLNNWIPLNKDRQIVENEYPYMPSRIIDNIIRDNVYISVVNWSTFSGNVENLAGLIDVSFKNRKNNRYDHSTLLRKNNS